MSVGVVRTHGDQRQPGTAGGEEIGVGVGAAVVRHLEHVGTQVHACREEPGPGPGTEVAGEQDAHAPVRDPRDHRQVVGFHARGGTIRRGSEHLDLRPAHRAAVTRDEHRSLSPASADHGVERRHAVVGRGQGAGGDDTDGAPRQRPCQATRMVGVQVGHEDQRERVDAQPVQAPVDRSDVGSGVDQHPGTRRRGHDEGIPLPHVASHHDGVLGRPATDDLTCRPAQHDQPHDGGESQRAQPGKPPQHPPTGQEESGQQDGPTAAGRPAGRRVRDSRGTLGHEHEPTRRPARDPDQRVTQRGRDGPDQHRHEPEHRGRGDGRRREEVGRQRDEADRARQARDDRRGDEAGCGADGQGVGDHPWDPSPLQAA
jgi:hypothetical protein